MLRLGLEHPGPITVRYPRGRAVGVDLEDPVTPVPLGRAETLRTGRDILLLAVGSTVHPCLAAAEDLADQGIEAAVVDGRFIKPLDEETILSRAAEAGRVLCVEENSVLGGFGSAVTELTADRLPGVRVKILGVPDRPVERKHGPQARLRAALGLDREGVVRAALEMLEQGSG